MRFKLEVEFEMESMPRTYSLPSALAETLLPKKGGEIEFFGLTVKRLTNSGTHVLETIREDKP